MHIIITILALIFLVPAAAAVIYLIFLAAVALLSIKRRTETVSHPQTRFSIIIPAHNEEKTIQKTIHSCQALDYSADLFDIYVVADNCADQTAQIAEQLGARVLERNDPKKRGKGFALSYAFGKLLPQNYDMFIILDADCIIDKHALNVFDRYVREGHRVLQANDVTSNPDDTPMSYALAVGNVIENDLFYAPKSMLGLAVLLRGTGMAFHKKVLEEIPWDAFSVAEDADYSLRLLRQNINVTFVQEVKVASEFPVTKEQLEAQRSRWAQGNFQLGKAQALKLIKEGLFGTRPLLVDAGWTLLILSKPFILGISLLALLASGTAWIIKPTLLNTQLASWSLFVFLGLAVYFVIGILLLGLNRKRLKYIVSVPQMIVKLGLISVKNLFSKNQKDWEKTPRT
ncbi:MAG TPA: glycosyltransferase [Caldithrix abyssi]|uniref:Glycosyltransferase n=1 Tax=Caldithrix abyssi TaxID=187145 RepID=A0A7V4U1G4_CALAY|nr:glycosyltransferase [Caldithrix abyssi]